MLANGEMQARMNVIHEVSLFQGRLGFERAVICLTARNSQTLKASAKSGSDETISVRRLTKSGACLSAKVLSKKLDLVTVGEVRRTRGARAAGMSAADETGHAVPRQVVRL